MNRLATAVLTLILAVAAGATGALAAPDDARQPPRVGELYFGNVSGAAYGYNGFREGLRELGYVDGQNIVLITRFANGDPERLKEFVVEFVALKVDAMFINIKAVPTAKRLTSTIPIVSAGFADPVAEGLVHSLAQPGGNITGVSWQSNDVSGKRLQLAMEVVPGLKHVAVLVDPQDPSIMVEARALHGAAGRAGIRVSDVPVQGDSDFGTALTTIRSVRPNALIAVDLPALATRREQLSRFAIENRLPFISEGRHWAEVGALLTYGPSGSALFKRAAYYVDRILKGVKPADLPIEQPTTFELVINLKTAKALGISIPESMLLRADAVIR